jgi:hypothetical protein
MNRGILLTISFLLLAPAMDLAGMGKLLLGPQEAACVPVFKAEPIHPLPEWDGQENIRPRRVANEEGSPTRLKISLPVGVLASLLLFLMWKLMQGQE